MADINTEKLRSLNTLLSTTGGDVQERMHQWLVANVTGASVDQDLDTLWKAYLVEQGYNTGDVGTDTLAYLAAKGYTGDLDTASLAAWAADDYLGVAITYLLRQTFTAGNTALANGNTITGPGGGGTVESSDADDTGTLTVRENAADTTVSITSNKFTATKPTLAIAEPDVGVYETSGFTRAAGRVIGWTYNSASDGAGRHSSVYDSNAAGVPATADRVYLGRVGYSGSLGHTLITFNPAGTVENNMSTTSGLTAGTDIKARLVQGGYSSAGVPDSTGDYGASLFFYNGSAWELALSAPGGLNTATFYPDFLISESIGGNTTQTLENCFVSDTTVEAVFTPTGNYIADSFTDTNGTLVTAHTAESGAVWELPTTTNVYSINNNTVYISTYNEFGDPILQDVGSGDCFVYGKWNKHTSVIAQYLMARADDTTGSDDYWAMSHGDSKIRIYERTAGTLNVRATTLGLTSTTSGTAALRCSGTAIEGWAYNDGGTSGKVSYTSSNKQANTKVGLAMDTGNTASNYDAFGAWALTHTDYDTALDSF